jgi:uncharacterized protein (DUF488 family)
MNRQAIRTVFTVGHSTRTLAEFVALLREVGVTLLVDVRSIPRSRAMPQFNKDTLPDALAAAGIGYRHLGALGGRRYRRKSASPSPNTYWRVKAFRDYADYAETSEFRAGLDHSMVHSVMCCTDNATAALHRLRCGVAFASLVGNGRSP